MTAAGGRAATPAGQLTPAQKRVVAEFARGGNREDVAARLRLSIHTVKAHLRKASKRMGATSTAHLVALAIAHRLIPAGTALPNGAAHTATKTTPGGTR